MAAKVDPSRIYSITRPDPSLLTLYVLYSILTFVMFPIVLTYLLIRYYTLQYRFDDQGVRMSHGLLFRSESLVQYSRIQDLHISRGLLERWLGLATIQVQTAAGSASPEMTLVGIRNFEEVRDFMYSRMRGARYGEEDPSAPEHSGKPDEVVALLTEIRNELRWLREHHG